MNIDGCVYHQLFCSAMKHIYLYTHLHDKTYRKQRIKINVSDQTAWKHSFQRTKGKSTVINALSYDDGMRVFVVIFSGSSMDKWFFWKAFANSSPWKSLTWWKDGNGAGRKRSGAPGHAPCSWWWSEDTVMYRRSAPAIPSRSAMWRYSDYTRASFAERKTQEQRQTRQNKTVFSFQTTVNDLVYEVITWIFF